MPRLMEWAIHKLHPTQITVGMIEIEDKKHHLAKLARDELREFMGAHRIPVVSGPVGKLYVTDHHHLLRAALEAGIEEWFLRIEADFSSDSLETFWKNMDRRGWVHPLDENGVRHHYSAIPRRLERLADDVYRSLARYVRAAGGYDKTPTAFAEFEWADFFRRLVAVEDVRADFNAAVAVAVRLAKSARARGMPGYRGT